MMHRDGQVETNIQVYKCPKCQTEQVGMMARYICKKCGYRPIDFISRQWIADKDIIEWLNTHSQTKR